MNRGMNLAMIGMIMMIVPRRPLNFYNRVKEKPVNKKLTL